MKRKVDLMLSKEFAERLEKSIGVLLGFKSPRLAGEFLEVGREIARENNMRRGLLFRRIYHGNYTVSGRGELIDFGDGLKSHGHYEIYFDSKIRRLGRFGFRVITSLKDIGPIYVSAESEIGAKYRKRILEGYTYADREEVLEDLRSSYPTELEIEVYGWGQKKSL